MPRSLWLLALLCWVLGSLPRASAQGTPSPDAGAAPAKRDAGAAVALPAAATPPRPASEAVQEPASRLFQAIVRDDPTLAEDFFFPRDAFVQLKAMQRPERYHARLFERFVADIHALHRQTPDLPRAAFVKLELGTRGGWVRPGEEGNKLPYWAARHAWLHYRIGAQLRRLEVRVLITWQDRWYVIHLREFR